MQQLQACIFDLDGVLCDTARYHFLAWKSLADELGISFTQEDNERLKGVSRMDSLDILLSLGNHEFTAAEKAAMAQKKNDLYLTYIERMTPDETLPGAVDFLNEVRAAGIKTALGSVSKNARGILDRLQIAPLLDFIADGNTVALAKPAPDIFLAGQCGLGVSAAGTAVFEDAVAGVEAALRAEMKCVGIGEPSILTKAHLVVPDFTALTLHQVRALF